VRPDASRLLSPFAITWFNTSAGKDHFFRNVKTSSGLGSINSTELRAAPIPLPPLPMQQAMMKRVEAGRAEIARLKADRRPGPRRGGQGRRGSDDPGHEAGIMELHKTQLTRTERPPGRQGRPGADDISSFVVEAAPPCAFCWRARCGRPRNYRCGIALARAPIPPFEDGGIGDSRDFGGNRAA
jgi:hypothetical protein